MYVISFMASDDEVRLDFDGFDCRFLWSVVLLNSWHLHVPAPKLFDCLQGIHVKYGYWKDDHHAVPAMCPETAFIWILRGEYFEIPKDTTVTTVK
jgi:hypothetical protein